MGLGSNLGDREGRLKAACRALAALPGLRLAAVSSLYWTEPQDAPDQPWFANQVACLECGPKVTALRLLRSLLAVEHELGRVRLEHPAPRYEPRAIDLDLLLFGNEVRATTELTLPHPRLCERAFVLVPLREIAPGLVFPDKKSLDEVLEKVSFRVDSDRIWQPATSPEGKEGTPI